MSFVWKQAYSPAILLSNRIAIYILQVSKKITSYIFQGMFWKSFGKFSEKRFQQSCFQTIQAVQSTTYNFIENKLHLKFCLLFKIARRASEEESFLVK